MITNSEILHVTVPQRYFEYAQAYRNAASALCVKMTSEDPACTWPNSIVANVESIILGALAGIFVYVIGQLLSKFFIEPLYELRKSIGEVRFILSLHAPTIHTPIGRSKESSEEASEALRRCSSDLIAKLHAIPFYKITSLGVLPSRSDIEQAAVQLRGLATFVHEEGEKANASIEKVNKRVERIEYLLRFKPLEEIGS